MNAGAAYIYRYDAARLQWIEEAKLVASDAEPEDPFGARVTIPGDLALVGSRCP